MRVSEFPLERLDPDSGKAYNPLNEAFVLGLDDAHELEWVVDDAVAQFGERRMESTLGERFRIHESGATFLVLKGWAKLV